MEEEGPDIYINSLSSDSMPRTSTDDIEERKSIVAQPPREHGSEERLAKFVMGGGLTDLMNHEELKTTN